MRQYEFFEFSYVSRCDLKNFKFENYPKWFEKLNEFHWKPVLIAESLMESNAIWYMDISIDWEDNNVTGIQNWCSNRTLPLCFMEATGNRWDILWKKEDWTNVTRDRNLKGGGRGNSKKPIFSHGYPIFLDSTRFNENKRYIAKIFSTWKIFQFFKLHELLQWKLVFPTVQPIKSKILHTVKKPTFQHIRRHPPGHVSILWKSRSIKTITNWNDGQQYLANLCHPSSETQYTASLGQMCSYQRVYSTKRCQIKVWIQWRQSFHWLRWLS